MSYFPLPTSTKFSDEQFIHEMYFVLHSLSGFKNGIDIKCDSNGYLSELHRIKSIKDTDLIVAVRKLLIYL
jgi:hypothetical protein